MKRLKKVRISWSHKFAYVVGLITTDGCLSSDGRHIDVTSKDRSLIISVKNCLGINNKIGRKSSGRSVVKRYFRIQFGDINFYEFLLTIGLTPAKSKTLSIITVPNIYFSDFLRGCLDGDGNISVVKHPESRFPQLRVRFYSGSFQFLEWLKMRITRNTRITRGWMETGSGVYHLAYGKEDSIRLLRYIYNSKGVYYLRRKFKSAQKFL